MSINRLVKEWEDKKRAKVLEGHTTAYHRAMAADKAYGDELRRVFGKHAGDVRYSPEGKGLTGSVLRRLHDAKLEADSALYRAGCALRSRRVVRDA